MKGRGRRAGLFGVDKIFWIEKVEGNRRRLEGNRRRLEGNRRRLEGNHLDLWVASESLVKQQSSK